MCFSHCDVTLFHCLRFFFFFFSFNPFTTVAQLFYRRVFGTKSTLSEITWSYEKCVNGRWSLKRIQIFSIDFLMIFYFDIAVNGGGSLMANERFKRKNPKKNGRNWNAKENKITICVQCIRRGIIFENLYIDFFSSLNKPEQTFSRFFVVFFLIMIFTLSSFWLALKYKSLCVCVCVLLNAIHIKCENDNKTKQRKN